MEERVKAIEEWIDVEDRLRETTVNELKAMNRNWEANTQALRAVVPAIEQLDTALYAQKMQLARLGVDQGKNTEMLLHLKDRADKVDERLDKIDERFEKIDQRFEKIDQRFEKIDERFTAQDLKLSKMDGKLDVLIDLLSRKLT